MNTTKVDLSRSESKPISLPELLSKREASEPKYKSYIDRVLTQAKRTTDQLNKFIGQSRTGIDNIKFQIDGYGGILPFGENYYGHPQYKFPPTQTSNGNWIWEISQ